jgi:nicotinate-nucleotide adenylyltransferase
LETRRIGIMGGSFNPVHVGHLMAAQGAREAFQLERVIFIPAGMPPHKQAEMVAPAVARFRMVELAIAGNQHFEISAIELERQGPSYTVDTLRELREQLRPAELFFIIGADSINELPTWRNIGEVLKLCRIIAAARPGWPAVADTSRLAAALGDEAAEAIRRGTFEIPLVAVSSTAIRERIRAGREIRYMIPDAVREYILAQRLYQ